MAWFCRTPGLLERPRGKGRQDPCTKGLPRDGATCESYQALKPPDNSCSFSQQTFPENLCDGGSGGQAGGAPAPSQRRQRCTARGRGRPIQAQCGEERALKCGRVWDGAPRLVAEHSARGWGSLHRTHRSTKRTAQREPSERGRAAGQGRAGCPQNGADGPQWRPPADRRWKVLGSLSGQWQSLSHL